MRGAPVLVLAALVLLAGCGAEDDGAAFRAGFVYVGPIGDAGWTYAHDQGRLALERAFPDVATTALESVPESEAEGRIEQLARHGHDVVFTTSFGFMDPTLAVAGRHPDVLFLHCSGYKRRANVGTYFGRMYEAKFLAGLIAGSLSRTGIIGYVAPHQIPEVVRHIDAFALGVRTVAPATEVRVVWTHSWFDPAKEKEATVSLLDAGADLIATGCDSAAPLIACEERGAMVMGYDSDNRRAAPTAFLTAPIWDWSILYIDFVRRVREGRLTDLSDLDYWDGLASGVVDLAPLSDRVGPDVGRLVDDYRQRIVAGTFEVFGGPIADADGRVRVAAGTALDDDALRSMFWFVEGVVGQLPESSGE